MMISLFELFKIGIGPSSSHTVGPMLATNQFAAELAQISKGSAVARIVVELFGSLALTGMGHSTDRATILGLEGAHPRTIDPKSIEPRFAEIVRKKLLHWNGTNPISFELNRDLVFHRTQSLPR